MHSRGSPIRATSRGARSQFRDRVYRPRRLRLVQQLGAACEGSRECDESVRLARASERARKIKKISAFYYSVGTGELDKANQSYEMWKQSYPRDPLPYGNLGNNHMMLGRWDMALLETEERLRLEASSSVAEGNLACIQLRARPHRGCEENGRAGARTETGTGVQLSAADSYLIAFLRGDQDAMQRELVGQRGAPARRTGCSRPNRTRRQYSRPAGQREGAFAAGRRHQRAAPIPRKPPLYGRSMLLCARRSLATRWPLVTTQWHSALAGTGEEMSRRWRRWRWCERGTWRRHRDS